MGFSRSCIAVALMAVALPVRAQGGAPEPQIFGESIDVRVVNVEAVVTDGKGERVRGLEAGDFRLLVDGKEVPIEYFAEVAEGTAAAAGTAAPVAAGEAVARNYLIYRLIVQLGTPHKAGRGQVELPVTLGVPVEALALTPKGRGYVAETPLSVSAMDEKGGLSDLPGSRLQVEIQKPPAAGTYARFQTTVRLRDAGQRLVFTVRDPVEGKTIWGEAVFAPKEKRVAK